MSVRRVDFVWHAPRDRNSIKPVYNFMKNNLDIDCRLIQIPKINFFNKRKYADIADTIVIAYDAPLRRLKRIGWKGKHIYIEHGLGPVKYYTYKYNFFHEASMLFYPGEIFKRKMEALNPSFKGGLLGGYPKCDELVKLSVDRDRLCKLFNLNPSKPVILFAPSWGAKYGAGILNVKYFNDIDNVISMPHPNDYKRAKKLNVHFPPKESNINEILHLADIVVSDVSSIIAEAALVGKTVVQLELEEYPGCFPAKESRKKGVWVSEEIIERENSETDRSVRPFKVPYIDEDWNFGYSCKPEAIRETITFALQNPDKYKELAGRMAKDSCYKCDGRISERIARMIEKYLESGEFCQL